MKFDIKKIRSSIPLTTILLVIGLICINYNTLISFSYFVAIPTFVVFKQIEDQIKETKTWYINKLVLFAFVAFFLFHLFILGLKLLFSLTLGNIWGLLILQEKASRSDLIGTIMLILIGTSFLLNVWKYVKHNKG